jgi:hypothetical protein
VGAEKVVRIERERERERERGNLQRKKVKEMIFS